MHKSSTAIAQPAQTRLSSLQPTAAASLNGILILLVTDIEGFTALVERLGDLNALTVMRRHNQLLRTCIRSHHGVEVVHTGDGILAAFRSLAAALECAHDIQHALDQPPQAHGCALRVRMGLHAGEPLPEDSRLFGHCVNMTVRVCGSAQAGQVLVTEVVKQLAQGRFAFSHAVRRRLKGISEPVRLFELLPSCLEHAR